MGVVTDGTAPGAPGRAESERLRGSVPSTHGALAAAAPFRPTVVAVGLLLAGYLFANRGFAYLGVPGTPVFIGEVVLAIALVQAARISSALRTVLSASPFVWLLAAFMALGALRATWDIPTYGLMLAARDSAIWYYGAFTVAVAILLVRRPGALHTLLRWYRRVVPLFLVWAPVVVLLASLPNSLPRMPGSPVSVLSYKPGDLAVHVTIALAFLWLCGDLDRRLRFTDRQRVLLTGLGIATIGVAGSQNRGGLLAAMVGLGAVVLLTARRRQLVTVLCGSFVLIVVTALASELQVDLGRRELSVQQLRDNVVSIVQPSDQRDGTARWRMEFWSAIAGDTVSGRNGPFGLGFGINLAHHYDARSSSFDTDRPLRSAHNSHLTVLGRMGGPGIALWVSLWVAWFAGMAAVIRRARSARQEAQLLGGVGAWVAVAAAVILTNAVFDPTLEAPQTAAWLWTLAGVGCVLMRSARALVARPPRPILTG